MRNTVGLFFVIGEFIVMDKSLEINLKELESIMYKEKVIDVKEYDNLKVTFETLNDAPKSEIPTPFTIEQMLYKLETKNLYFPDIKSKEKCVELLHSVGYYNLKHFMYNEFGKDEPKNFDEVYILYKFDRYLLKQLFSLVNMLETHIRNIILEVYMLEIEYNNKPSTLFYLDKDLYFEKVNDEYKYSAKKLKEFNRLQNVFWRAIEKKKSNDNVKHNIKKYNIIPAWVLFQNFSFGDLSTFYRTTLPTYRNKVSKRIENLIEKNTGISIKLPEKLLCAWLNSIRFLRNRIAHTDIIYGINFTNTCAKHHSDEEMYVNIEKYKYQQRLVTFLLAMKKIFMSMPENNIIEWNETLTKIENKCSEHNFIKLSRLGVIENNLSYFKITK